MRSASAAIPWSSDAVSPSPTRSVPANTVSPSGAVISTLGAESASTSISNGAGTSVTGPPTPDASQRSRVDLSATSRPLNAWPSADSGTLSPASPVSVTEARGTDARPLIASEVPRGSRSGSPTGRFSAGRPR